MTTKVHNCKLIPYSETLQTWDFFSWGSWNTFERHFSKYCVRQMIILVGAEATDAPNAPGSSDEEPFVGHKKNWEPLLHQDVHCNLGRNSATTQVLRIGEACIPATHVSRCVTLDPKLIWSHITAKIYPPKPWFCSPNKNVQSCVFLGSHYRSNRFKSVICRCMRWWRRALESFTWAPSHTKPVFQTLFLGFWVLGRRRPSLHSSPTFGSP